MRRTSCALLLHALLKFAAGLLAAGLLLFLPAGTLNYPGARRLLVLLFVPLLLVGAVLFFRAPALLQKRLRAREPQAAHRGVVAASGLLFVLGFAAAGLDFRFGWTSVPPWLVRAASLLLLAAYACYAEVLRENAWLSRTVEVQRGQRVIDTGLYGIVRHPMYLATLALFLSIPLVLGSWVSFAAFLPYPALLVRRIRSEEAVLRAQLPGYAAYMRQVRYRLVPFLW